MNRNRLAVLVIVIVALLVSATAAFPSLASSLFFNGTADGTEGLTQRYTCGTPLSPYMSFTAVPTATGVYNYSDHFNSTDINVMIFYPSFNPADSTVNRIAALDDGGIVTLTAGNVYTFVVHRHCGDLAAGNTWEFRMTYLSAAAPAAPAAPAAAPDASWDPGDARLNRQPAQPTAVYCEAQGLFAYGPQGQPMLYASWEAIEAAGVPTNAPLPLDMNEAMHAGFFRLPDGWFQIVVNGGPEEYIYRWDGCPMTHTITEVFSTATGERLVYEAQ